MFSTKVLVCVLAVLVAMAMAACKDDPADTDDDGNEVKTWPASWQGVWKLHGAGQYCDEDTLSDQQDSFEVICEGKSVGEVLVGDEMPCTFTVSNTKATANCVQNFTDPETTCKVTQTSVITLNLDGDKIAGTIRHTVTSTNCAVERGCYLINVTADRLSDGTDECDAPAVVKGRVLDMVPAPRYR